MKLDEYERHILAKYKDYDTVKRISPSILQIWDDKHTVVQYMLYKSLDKLILNKEYDIKELLQEKSNE